jgi:restriction system protein
MAIPDTKELVLPVLAALQRGSRRPIDLREELAQAFLLTPQDLAERLSNGQTVFANRIAFVLRYTGPCGATQKGPDGTYELTEYGRSLLTLAPDAVAAAIMRRRGGASASSDAPRTVEPGHPEMPSGSPAQQLDELVRAMREVLEAELLDEVRRLPPASFERLIVRLLEAMDYGSTTLRQGGAGDEGIDGAVDEDELGLGRIYVQAKRYKEGNVVGPAAIREFVGALTNAGASKGVFVTASTFSSAARDALPRGNNAARIALIDGVRLVQLMVRHGIGVRTAQTVLVKEIDRADLEPDISNG